MDLSRLAEIDKQLEILIDLPPQQREAQLRDYGRTDAERETLLRKLLAVSLDAATGQLRDGVLPQTSASAHAPPPDIPGYVILRELGRGGMATVFEATRTMQGVSRTVAIKLMGNRIEDPRARDRFVREQQILASLRHRNIASLVDVGEVDGRPWIAMERVDGEPIDAFFLSKPTDVAQVLAAAIDIADAVQAAHELFIVHRDIKPDNVLIDADGTVKLIDFGIATILEGSDRPLQRVTETGAAPLTLRYASPEQLRGERVGIASDIYQIGLLLFRLLTGAWPYAEGEDQLPLARTRLDTVPRRPSDAVTDRALARRLRGDLDSIVLRCLEPRPEDRYRSARDVQLDLQRHLDSRPVSARRHSQLYLVRTFVRRHRVGVALGLSLVVALVAGLIVAVDMARRSNAYARQMERVLDVAVEVLNETDPYVAGATLSSADASLRRIRGRVLEDEGEDPGFRARILTLLASIHERRGQHDEAMVLLDEVLAIARRTPLPPRLEADAVMGLARDLNSASRNTEALEVLDDHAALLSEHAHYQAQSLLARIEQQGGDVDAAHRRLEDAADRIGTKPDLSVDERALLNQLAIARGGKNDDAGSILAAERAFRGFEPHTGKEIVSWISYAMNLAVAYGEARRYRDMRAVHDQVSIWIRDTLGPEHPQFSIVEQSRAMGMMFLARYREALQVFDAARESASRQRLPLHRVEFERARGIAQLYGGQPDEAVATTLGAVRLAADGLAEVAGRRERVEDDLAWALFEVGAYREAYEVSLPLHAGTQAKYRKAAMVRVLVRRLGVPPGIDFDAADRALVNESACMKVDLATIEAAITKTAPPFELDLPSTCDGHGGQRVLALGGRWQPDWGGDFPPPAFESPLVERLLAGDLAPRPLPPELAAALNDWQAKRPRG